MRKVYFHCFFGGIVQTCLFFQVLTAGPGKPMVSIEDVKAVLPLFNVEGSIKELTDLEKQRNSVNGDTSYANPQLFSIGNQYMLKIVPKTKGQNEVEKSNLVQSRFVDFHNDSFKFLPIIQSVERVKNLEIKEDNQDVPLLYELMEMGHGDPLATLWESTKTGEASESNIESIFYLLGQVMAHMHQLGVLHGDFHDKNILVHRLGDNFKIFVIDWACCELDPPFYNSDFNRLFDSLFLASYFVGIDRDYTALTGEQCTQQVARMISTRTSAIVALLRGYRNVFLKLRIQAKLSFDEINGSLVAAIKSNIMESFKTLAALESKYKNGVYFYADELIEKSKSIFDILAELSYGSFQNKDKILDNLRGVKDHFLPQKQ